MWMRIENRKKREELFILTRREDGSAHVIAHVKF
jgi:hypothetical protein